MRHLALQAYRETKVLPSISRKLQTICLQLPPERHHEEVEGTLWYSTNDWLSHSAAAHTGGFTLNYCPKKVTAYVYTGRVNPPVEEWLSACIRI